MNGAASLLAAKGAALSGGANVLASYGSVPVRRTFVLQPELAPVQPCVVSF